MKADHLSIDAVQQLLAGDVEGAPRAAIEHHLDECSTCRLLVAESVSIVIPASGDRVLPVVPDHHYVIGNEVGRGGLGRVLRARHVALDRTVAIKELLRRDPAFEQRFVREALVTARLEHPAIVPVHEVGRWSDGEPFYAMKLVDGQTLATLLRRTRTLADRLPLLVHVVAVGEALAYAHRQRIIHRDVKPANIIIGEFGETYLLDWGLAKFLDEPRASGETDELVGTPAYMAPEQARGAEVDERADVYSLGVVLHEVLTGGLPSADASQPELPVDLEAIVHKAIADPAERYATAKELVLDLGRFQAGRLIGARKYSRLERIARWLQRHRRAAALVAVAVVALAVMAIASVVRIRRARDRLLEVVGELHVEQAREFSFRSDHLRALAFLGAALDVSADSATTRFLIARATGRLDQQLVSFSHRGTVRTVTFSPDGSRLVTGADGGEAHVWDLARDREIVELRGHRADVIGAVFSPDGTRLITADASGVIIVRDSDGTQRLVLHGFEPAIVAGDGLAARDGDAISIWDLRDGTRRSSLAARDAAWSTNGARIAVGPQIHVATTGALLCTVALAAPVRATAFDRAGTLAAFATAAEIAIVEVERCAVVTRIHADIAGDRVSFGFALSAARLLARVNHSHSIRVWDTHSGDLVDTLVWHTGATTSASASPDGETILTTGVDRTFAIWSARHGAISDVMTGHDSSIECSAFAPGGATFATGSADHTARVWRAAKTGLVASLVHRTRVTAERFAAPDQLVTLDDNGTVTRWNVAMATVAFERRGACPIAARCTLDADGARVLVVHGERVTVTDLRGAPGGELPHAAAVRAIAIGPGAFTATATDDGTVTLWDAARAHRVYEIRVPGGASTLAWNAATSRFATNGPGGLAVWRADGALVRRFPSHEHSESVVAFDASGRRVLGPNQDGDVAVWDIDSGRLLAVLEGHQSNVVGAAFSPDGNFVATASSDAARLHDAATGAVLAYFDRTFDYSHGGTVAFRADGQQLAVGGVDLDARVWNVAPDARATAAIAADIACRVPYRVSGLVALPVSVAPRCR